MYAIPLIQRWIARNSLEKEGYQHHALLTRERFKRLVYSLSVLATRIGGRFHSRQQHRYSARLDALNDLRQILLHLVNTLASKNIVCPKLEYDYSDVSFECPLNPPESTCCRVA